MTQKPLDPNADALLAILTETFARVGRVERDTLNVEARGRGIEVGRALAALKDAGAIEEYTTTPGFLRRLFGAKPHVMLRPLEAAGSAPAAGSAQAQPPEQTGPEQTLGHVVPESPADLTDAAAEPPVPPSATQPGVPPEAAPKNTSAPLDAAPAAILPPAALAPEVPTGPADNTATSGAAPATTADQAPPQVVPAAPAATVDTAPEAQPEARPNIAAPQAPAQVAAHVPPPRAPHFAPDDYTDKVGGGDAIEIGATVLDPDVLDGLRETLSDLGMELTMAGEALISDRMGRGDSAGDALSQVVLFAFAHAVHYDLLSGGGMQALGLTDYAIEVMQELEKLRDAGAITSERFESDMRRLWSFVGDADAGELLRADRAAEVLTDPMGGAAPTAILPEDIQTAEDPDSED